MLLVVSHLLKYIKHVFNFLSNLFENEPVLKRSYSSDSSTWQALLVLVYQCVFPHLTTMVVMCWHWEWTIQQRRHYTKNIAFALTWYVHLNDSGLGRGVYWISKTTDIYACNLALVSPTCNATCWEFLVSQPTTERKEAVLNKSILLRERWLPFYIVYKKRLDGLQVLKIFPNKVLHLLQQYRSPSIHDHCISFKHQFQAVCNVELKNFPSL